jgi:ABC-type long-subunit fatty acid transport system fused permease/ATPase subunit
MQLYFTMVYFMGIIMNKMKMNTILTFMYPIYNYNWRNINTIYIYKTRLASNEIFSPSNTIHRDVGRAKDLSAPRYLLGILY